MFNLDFFRNIFQFFLKYFLGVILIVIGFYILTKIVTFIVKRVIRSLKKTRKMSIKRTETIESISVNFIKYIFFILMIFCILIYVGISTQTLIASAGVLGIVIGIGAQELINDAVNGFFLLFEGTYDIGEYIQSNEYEGYVETLGMKSTVLRTYEHKRITIPNSRIREIINYSKNNYTIFYNFSASYDEKIESIEKLIDEYIIKDIRNIDHVFDVEYLGIDELGDSAIVYTLQIDTLPEFRFFVKRRANAVIKNIFDKNSLEIPYQNITLSYKGRDDDEKVE